MSAREEEEEEEGREREPDEGGKRGRGEGKATGVRQGGTSDLGAPRERETRQRPPNPRLIYSTILFL